MQNRLLMCLAFWLNVTFKLSRKFILCLICSPATELSENPPCKFNTLSSTETWNPKEVSSVQHKESFLMQVSHSVITLHESKWFFKRWVFFSYFLSAAACSRGLVVSVWWCNTVTVLLQSSRKGSATAFKPTLPSDKDTYTAQQQSRHCWEQTSWSQGRGAEMSCISYEI